MFRLTHEIVFNFYLDIIIELLRDNIELQEYFV